MSSRRRWSSRARGASPSRSGESVSTTRVRSGAAAWTAGEEAVGRRQVEEERGERVDRGGEAALDVGVEALAAGHEGDPPLGGAARDRSPGALDALGGGEVEPPHLVQLLEEGVAQAGGGRGIERAGEEREDAPAEAVVGDEALGLDELERQQREDLLVAPRAAAAEGEPTGAGGRAARS